MNDHNIRRFTAYRPAVPTDTHNEDQRNESDQVQYEGVVFSDGSCAIRWRTAVNSTSFWDSFEDAMRIHGHPEYGTRIVFHDEPIPLPWEEEEEVTAEDIQEVLGAVVGTLLGRDCEVRILSAHELPLEIRELLEGEEDG